MIEKLASKITSAKAVVGPVKSYSPNLSPPNNAQIQNVVRDVARKSPIKFKATQTQGTGTDASLKRYLSGPVASKVPPTNSLDVKRKTSLGASLGPVTAGTTFGSGKLKSFDLGLSGKLARNLKGKLGVSFPTSGQNRAPYVKGSIGFKF